MKTVVLYQSKYGSTKKYAHWLGEELGCEVMETKHASIEEVQNYDRILLGGGIYAGGIAGISFLKKHYSRLSGKKIAVFGVGASFDCEDARTTIRQHSLQGALAEIPCFYCRGGWNFAKMTLKDRMMCGMLKKMLAKKEPATREPWEVALFECFDQSKDWTARENLAEILAFTEND